MKNKTKAAKNLSFFKKNMDTAKIMRDSVYALAQYHECGSKAIENSFEIACVLFNDDNENFEKFYDKINIREINRFDFMYNTDTENWADDAQMMEYFIYTFGDLLKK